MPPKRNRAKDLGGDWVTDDADWDWDEVRRGERRRFRSPQLDHMLPLRPQQAQVRSLRSLPLVI